MHQPQWHSVGEKKPTRSNIDGPSQCHVDGGLSTASLDALMLRAGVRMHIGQHAELQQSPE